MSAITVVVTCRGRLTHLAQTLPKYAGKVPVVLVDYDCPDGAAEWALSLSHPDLTVLRRPAVKWHAAAARNDGLGLVRTPFTAFVDADTVALGDFRALRPSPNAYYVAHHDGPPPRQPELMAEDWFCPSAGDDLCGFMLCPTVMARSVGGYDEGFVGWGAEDTDFRTRLASLGLRHGRVPRGFLSFIPHGHDLRHGVGEAVAATTHVERVELTNAKYRAKHAGLASFQPDAAPCPLAKETVPACR